MEFGDLLWLLIMFLVITRGLGAARKTKEPPKPPPSADVPERSGRPAEPVVRRAERPGREAGPAPESLLPSPGQRARAAKRSDPVTEFRRRLLEAAQEWEVEQRRRAGVPVEERAKTAPPRAEATIDRRVPARPGERPGRRPDPRVELRRRPEREATPRRRSSWEARDVTPDRVAGQLPERADTPTPPVTRPRAESPSSAARTEDREAGVPPGLPRSPPAAAQQPLARLDRFDPLKRAVILAEILGLPKASTDDPGSRQGGH